MTIFDLHFMPMTQQKRLNNKMNELSEYFKMWKIKTNPSKTQAIIFLIQRLQTKKSHNQRKGRIKHHSTCIIRVLFGQQFSKLKQHIDTAVNKLNRCFSGVLMHGIVTMAHWTCCAATACTKISNNNYKQIE